MTSARGVEGDSFRWPMLAVLCLGIVALTLNWFDVATAFPLIGAEFKVGLGSLSLLISLYIIGYGLTHIPGGVLATKIGMKRTLVLGLLVQGAAGVMSGLSYSYVELAIFRVASGVGGSVFVAMTAASMVVWFREKEVTFALGVTGGAAFSAGAALALYGWLYVQRAVGWHASLVLGGVFELLVAVVTVAAFRLPDGGHSLGGVKFDRAALRSALLTRDLWVYGIALLGGYGAYFTTSQLFSQYVTTARHFDPSAGGLLSALILLAGIPGSVLGGHLADRSTNLRMFVVGPLVAVAALLALIPVAPEHLAVAPRDRNRLLPHLRLRRLAGGAFQGQQHPRRAHRLGDGSDAHACGDRRLLHSDHFRAPGASHELRRGLGLPSRRVCRFRACRLAGRQPGRGRRPLTAIGLENGPASSNATARHELR